ncbi:AI-2E family transporter [Syntrophorhabdus aromaticivorans]|uniref:AI-2E family transporter n=1 Tax=Syntrophorhabdus aromaticivorans TaxID=328301 RepID=A0A971M5B3_9BACT|nr:AI-2E family transporter [Syntrophorhabdus aromaticivorans]NLW35411.1 AI-2E family transporter [Syntrophorhabdus aromaticivorans]
MPSKRFYTLTLLFLLAVLGYLSYQIFRTFLSPIAWAMVLSIVFYPVFSFLLRWVKWKPLASLITLVFIIVLLLGPFSYFSYLLSQEIRSLIDASTSGQFDPVGSILHNPKIRVIIDKVLLLLNVSQADLEKTLVENLSHFGKSLLGSLTGGLGNVASAITDFIFMILSTFFFLEGGSEFVEGINKYIPFSKKQKDRLFKQTRDIIVSTIYGGVTVAIVQATFGGIAFSILGVPSPVLWGLAMFVTSFIPLVGTFVVWGPAAVYLFFKGALLNSIILVIIGVVAISSVDNILRPIIIRGKMQMPTLAIFFSILGGIKVFGFIGFIMGPLVLALFISVAQMLQYMDEEETEAAGPQG